MMVVRPRPALVIFGFLATAALVVLLLLTKPTYVPWRLSKTATGSDGGDPVIEQHYGVIMDAGSSGSRLHLYTWPTHLGDPTQLLDIRPLRDKGGRPLVKRHSPGLSSLASNPTRTAAYIEPFLAFAAEHIPAHKHSETPLYIMATAGMRMIPIIAQQRILEELRRHIRSHYYFLFNDRHVEIITGKQEGVFAWIATNYLLGRFSHNHSDSAPVVAVPSIAHGHLHFRKRTVGVIDMGGGSMQIAYEVQPNTAAATNMPDHLAAEFNLGCKKGDEEHTYRLYVSTFLLYGVNAARKRWEQFLSNERDALLRISTAAPTLTPASNNTSANDSTPAAPHDPSSTISSLIPDPCLPSGLPFRYHETKTALHGSGDLNKCVQGIRDHLLNLSAPCSVSPCSMAGVFQPPIDFLNTEFYGFSEFWYTSNDIMKLGGNYDYRRFFKTSKRFCGRTWPSLLARFRKGEFRDVVTLERLKLQCFKSAWILSVLHYGLHFPTSYRKFNSVIKIGGTEAQWTLGALLFRTRYFPLREVQRKELLKLRRHRSRHLSGNYQYLLLAGAVICVAVFIIHMHRTMRLSIWS